MAPYSNHYDTDARPMPALTVKNIPDELYDHLKASAQAHHRSINSELIHCLEASLMPRRRTAEDVLAGAQALRKQVKTKRIAIREIDAAKREGRK